MSRAVITSNASTLKWLGIAFVIKIPLFVFFSVQYFHNWPQESILNYLFVELADSSGYYLPLENFVNGLGYNSFCRMPGLLPLYAPLRLILDVTWTKTAIVVLQFITGTISVYVLALTAKLTFKSDQIFKYTLIVYALSSFVSIWDHCGGSDSFAVSFLIFSVYFAVLFKQQGQLKDLFLAGLFIGWSVFFRPGHGILIPIIGMVYIVNFKQLLRSAKHLAGFGLPVLIMLAVWTGKNYYSTKRVIVLQGPLSECFQGITKEMVAIRDLITAWGGDIQPWAKGSAGMWFFDSKGAGNGAELVEKNETTTAYNLDSLLKLRESYFRMQKKDISISERALLSSYIISRSEVYRKSYISEKPIRYYFVNRIKFLRLFLFRERLDNLPLPKFSEMKMYHKLIKGGYFLLLLMVNALGLIGCFMALKRSHYLPLIPLSMILILGALLGFVEQRYLAPIYPYLLILTAVPLLWLKNLIRAKKAGT